MTEHELEAVWAKILRSVRESGQFSLFGLLATMNDVEFADTQIFVPVYNDAEKNLLKQHWTTLQTLAGDTVELVLTDRSAVPYDENHDYVARIKDIFGEKVIISE